MRPAEDEILLALARTVVGVATRAADQLGRLSVVQLRALTVLRALDGPNLGRLAAGMGVTLSTASRLVDRLVSAGLVDRRLSPRSRRELTLTVTPAGQAILDRYDDLRLADMKLLLERLPEDRRPDAVAVLDQLAGSTAPGTAP
ncbi:MarR family winged helix-turn-helix transcriptional regulator [Blastococcus brunescens]|uniref:MarR family transcriptional regulator n=1 Tax=Blastococcus brunescens TaxID=1564165 RepID=A0ABZ1AZP6_9ACTN|nr:MarR family transcriptional regulator [Blastococcus sp. BMG 8361]WRL64035.1 MarR family transcriptional regulator [Blastococcus sp. BMG 8361]